jgi:hypothetical protein
MTNICQKCLLWCDENWGYLFDDPIVNEGIVVYSLIFFLTISSNGNFFQYGKTSTDYIKSKTIRPDRL